MLASDVVSLVESSGLQALSEAFAISRREAESLERRARRALNAGANPLMTSDQAGIVKPSQRPSEPLEDDQALDDLEQAAQDQARRIKHESYGVAAASVANLRSRLAVLQRNIRVGYGQDTDYDYRLTKRTLELAEVYG